MKRFLENLTMLFLASLVVFSTNLGSGLNGASAQLIPFGFQMDELIDEAGSHGAHRCEQVQSQKKLAEKKQVSKSFTLPPRWTHSARMSFSQATHPARPVDHRLSRGPPETLV